MISWRAGALARLPGVRGHGGVLGRAVRRVGAVAVRVLLPGVGAEPAVRPPPRANNREEGEGVMVMFDDANQRCVSATCSLASLRVRHYRWQCGSDGLGDEAGRSGPGLRDRTARLAVQAARQARTALAKPAPTQPEPAQPARPAERRRWRW